MPDVQRPKPSPSISHSNDAIPLRSRPEKVNVADSEFEINGGVVSIDAVGGNVSAMKFRLSLDKLVARSVCSTVIPLTPSPGVKTIGTENGEAVQLNEPGLETPPESTTVSPTSHVPVRVTPVCETVEGAGPVIESAGKLVSIVQVKLAVGVVSLFAKSIALISILCEPGASGPART
jgi:hypothetical protein